MIAPFLLKVGLTTMVAGLCSFGVTAPLATSYRYGHWTQKLPDISACVMGMGLLFILLQMVIELWQ